MSESIEDVRDSLTLGDRINYPYILGQALLNFQHAVVKPEGLQSPQEVSEASEMIRNSIPSAWIKQDEQFRDELKEARHVVEIDMRPTWCGRLIGEPQFIEDERFDPYKVYNACVNVFQRRGLLTKTLWIEKIVPEPEDFEDANDENRN